MPGFKPYNKDTHSDGTQSEAPPLIHISISKNAKIFTPRILYYDGIKKPKTKAKAKAIRYMCKHNRRQHDCTLCKGKNICEHGRIKRRCTKCGVGASVCVHKRQKIQCVLCKGTGICEHGKRKNTCRDCGGVSFCIHSKYPHTCIPCGGKYLCEHKKVSKKCRTCKALNESSTITHYNTKNSS